MEFRTIVDIPVSSWKIKPAHRLLFVGSCFAGNIGRRFSEERFRVQVNPSGVMYNPVSVQHEIVRLTADEAQPPSDVVFITLGTNHVYVLNETGEIVDNCNKRPQHLFTERELTVDECVEALRLAVDGLLQRNTNVHIVMTVSPIRYRKYGYHESQLSKATLLLAVDKLCKLPIYKKVVDYFPAYELVCDELRDYRFYEADMLHPSEQAVEYIWERFSAAYFGDEANTFMAEWKPIKEALAHKPFHPDSEEYRRFRADAESRLKAFEAKYADKK